MYSTLLYKTEPFGFYKPSHFSGFNYGAFPSQNRNFNISQCKNIIDEGRAIFGNSLLSVLVNLHLVSMGARELYMMDSGLTHPTFYSWFLQNQRKYNLSSFTDYKGNIYAVSSRNDSRIPELRMKVQSKKELGKLLGYYKPSDRVDNFNYSMQVVFSDMYGTSQVLFRQGSYTPFDPMYTQNLISKLNSASNGTGFYFTCSSNFVNPYARKCPCTNCQ